MIKVRINGKNYEAEKGEYILDLCRRNHIPVPALCRHEGLSGMGSCRLCVVEVDEGSGNRVVTSCVYPLSRDCEVFTESEKIKGIRRTILSMLKTRAPAGDRLASLCQMYGAEENARFTPPAARADKPWEKRLASACVLCGLCTQACASLGTGAISTVGRGVGKRVSAPYGESPAECIGCGSCASVCPAKAIECGEARGARTVWGRKFKLLRCAACGNTFATEEEYAWAQKKAALEKASAPAESAAVLCDICRRKKSADVFASAFGERA
jgi:NADH dehydrogenase/NADH:ubiquinone oxidoreductase subunit G